MTKLHLTTVASDVGSIYAGKSRAAAALREAGLQRSLAAAGWQVSESAALAPATWASSPRGPNGARNEARTVQACQEVKQAMLTALKASDGFQLILAGECLYCPPILSAYWQHVAQDQRVGLIYMDADCDLGTAADVSGTGNIAGMTLTHLTLRTHALESMRPFSRTDGTGVVDSSNMVLFGLNVASPTNRRADLGYLLDHGYRVHTSEAIRRAPEEEARKALRWMEGQVDQIVVHLDVDIIDPGEFPLCNVPNYTGVGFAEVIAALKVFLASGKTVALSLAEVNPDHDPELKMTSQLIDALVDALNSKLK